MEVLNTPKLTHLALGKTIKVIKVEGLTGMKMPAHHSTQEAVIVVQIGEALLQMKDEEHLLKAGDCFVVPAKKEHTLTILNDLEALAIMAVESEINFK
ncbi:cupin domain-containing protein [Maribacter sp. ACAM166]|uniref:cupin domain-containing protein n=1 Tax=Maribacter sp. ACAM166 TaxID=2508996 RepID=UPI0010FEBA61|nr:cupin domain-containing protein [Maribacter sp. ACAM166]TLP80191.1 cupin domain-containing protein [Maribacter sp. ACAM166]